MNLQKLLAIIGAIISLFFISKLPDDLHQPTKIYYYIGVIIGLILIGISWYLRIKKKMKY